MPIEPHRLLVLRAVRCAGGVLQASRALSLTPSAVSQHIARLEHETGLTLLDRTQRGGGRAARLTPEGIALCHRADAVAAALAEAEREAKQLAGHRGGTVRIGGYASVLTHLAAPALADLAISEPTIVPSIVEINHRAGRDELRAGRLDLLISWVELDTGDRPAEPDLLEEELLQDEYRVVVPTVWQLDSHAEILSRPWIALPTGHPANAVLDRLAGQTGATLEHAHICTDSRTMLALVAAGLGSAIVPQLTLNHLPTAGTTTVASPVDLGHGVVTLLRTDDSDEATSTVRRYLREQAARSRERRR